MIAEVGTSMTCQIFHQAEGLGIILIGMDGVAANNLLRVLATDVKQTCLSRTLAGESSHSGRPELGSNLAVIRHLEASVRLLYEFARLVTSNQIGLSLILAEAPDRRLVADALSTFEGFKQMVLETYKRIQPSIVTDPMFNTMWSEFFQQLMAQS